PLEGDDIGTESQVKRNVNLRLRVCAAASAEKSVRTSRIFRPVRLSGLGDCFLVIYDRHHAGAARPEPAVPRVDSRSVRGSERLPIVLIGNKTDMAHRGHVDKGGYGDPQQPVPLPHFLVSAAEDPKIVDLVFMGLAAEGQNDMPKSQKSGAPSRMSSAAFRSTLSAASQQVSSSSS
uniref:GTP-binding protein Rhes n=1 Tax=Macrostomum lignano TaxID=282301 RepID=A0A1I8FHC1_9PLAT